MDDWDKALKGLWESKGKGEPPQYSFGDGSSSLPEGKPEDIMFLEIPRSADAGVLLYEADKDVIEFLVETIQRLVRGGKKSGTFRLGTHLAEILVERGETIFLHVVMQTGAIIQFHDDPPTLSFSIR